MSSLKTKKSSVATTPPTQVSPSPPPSPAQVIIGHFRGLDDSGAPLVDFEANPLGSPVRALATAGYGEVEGGTPVALMFINGDLARPLALGVVKEHEAVPPNAAQLIQREETCTFSASRQLVLQCGQASIVLTSAGKVLIRGAYVSSRSSGMQRIVGASVQIN